MGGNIRCHNILFELLFRFWLLMLAVLMLAEKDCPRIISVFKNRCFFKNHFRLLGYSYPSRYRRCRCWNRGRCIVIKMHSSNTNESIFDRDFIFYQLVYCSWIWESISLFRKYGTGVYKIRHFPCESKFLCSNYLGDNFHLNHCRF